MLTVKSGRNIHNSEVKMRIGIITYNCRHLKTEQMVLKYSTSTLISAINIYMLPFAQRPARNVVFNHRPSIHLGIEVNDLSAVSKVTTKLWDGLKNISDECDFFTIAGAGILNIDFAGRKPVLNVHPGIIPQTRGLDSFKWAIYNCDPLGVTLHAIDNEVDVGKILEIKRTPVFQSDTIEILARRHYENELELVLNFDKILSFLNNTGPITENFPSKSPKMRMPRDVELEMLENFNDWKMKQLEVRV